MTLQVVGAGLSRTGTSLQTQALQRLIGGRVHHMSVIPGYRYAFELGLVWDAALIDEVPNWAAELADLVAAVDWPTSMFWREWSAAYPDALVLLSTRDAAGMWWQSAMDPAWRYGLDLVKLLQRFTGSEQWDDAGRLMAAYERHNAAVRAEIPPHRLLDWRVTDGWEPPCCALGVPVPDEPFPWINRCENWG